MCALHNCYATTTPDVYKVYTVLKFWGYAAAGAHNPGYGLLAAEILRSVLGHSWQCSLVSFLHGRVLFRICLPWQGYSKVKFHGFCYHSNDNPLYPLVTSWGQLQSRVFKVVTKLDLIEIKCFCCYFNGITVLLTGQIVNTPGVEWIRCTVNQMCSACKYADWIKTIHQRLCCTTNQWVQWAQVVIAIPMEPLTLFHPDKVTFYIFYWD